METSSRLSVDRSAAPPSSRRRVPGYTLIELMLVVAILGTLAAIAVPSYLGFVEKARVVRAKSEIQGISTVIHAYEISEGALPASLADVDQTPTLDPWGRPYVYLRIAGSSPIVDAEPPRPRFATGPGPLRLTRVSAPQPPSPPNSSPAPAPAPAPAPGEPPSTQNVIGLARKDRFLVPLNSDYDLYSKGKDGESVPPLSARQSQDDVVRANDGAYIGLASQY